MRFVDGTREAVDVIIGCTGYRVSFPFFDPGLICAPGKHLPLGESGGQKLPADERH